VYQNIEQLFREWVGYYNTTQIYTDASDSEGKTGIAVYIPDYKINI